MLSAGSLAVVFVIANVALGLAYHSRTYPRTRIMDTTIGSVPFGELAQKTSELKLLPQSVQLAHGSQKATVSPTDLGVREDPERSANSAKDQRSWLPILNVFKIPRLSAPVSINSDTFNKKAKELAAIFHKDAVNAHLELQGSTVSTAAAQQGYNLDTSKLEALILAGLDKDRSSIAVATKPIQPTVQASSLKPAEATLRQQLATTVTLRYAGQAKQASGEDLAKWFVRSGNGYELSSAAIESYVTTVGTAFGIHVKDISQTANAVLTAVKEHKNTDITLAKAVASRTFKYCVGVRGVDASNLPTLRSKLASTYSDSRGWSLGGLVAYDYVSTGCDYTVWLSAASQMTSFGGVCDAQWSCRSGNNVVINYDRWVNASDSWNASGGTNDNYRSMVINHETGHWLGFAHDHCGGPGQLAPVMQQQSIDLQGCTFNPWPLPKELSVLKSRLGV